MKTIIITLFMTHLLAGIAFGQDQGKFLGKVVSEWLPDGRRMKLVSSFSFIDSSNVEWDAPTGSIVDGASIPKFAWSIIGGPLEGKYREASVIHDVACDKKNRSWNETHKVFYEAMIVSGVNIIQAKIMYSAVYHFGPRWKTSITLENVTANTFNDRIAKEREKAGHDNYFDVSGSEMSYPSNHSNELHKFSVNISIIPKQNELTEEDFEALVDLIKSNNISIEDIMKYKISIR